MTQRRREGGVWARITPSAHSVPALCVVPGPCLQEGYGLRSCNRQTRAPCCRASLGGEPPRPSIAVIGAKAATPLVEKYRVLSITDIAQCHSNRGRTPALLLRERRGACHPFSSPDVGEGARHGVWSVARTTTRIVGGGPFPFLGPRLQGPARGRRWDAPEPFAGVGLPRCQGSSAGCWPSPPAAMTASRGGAAPRDAMAGAAPAGHPVTTRARKPGRHVAVRRLPSAMGVAALAASSAWGSRRRPSGGAGP
jgi:hypothetical protein